MSQHLAGAGLYCQRHGDLSRSLDPGEGIGQLALQPVQIEGQAGRLHRSRLFPRRRAPAQIRQGEQDDARQDHQQNEFILFQNDEELLPAPDYTFRTFLHSRSPLSYVWRSAGMARSASICRVRVRRWASSNVPVMTTAAG